MEGRLAWWRRRFEGRARELAIKEIEPEGRPAKASTAEEIVGRVDDDDVIAFHATHASKRREPLRSGLHANVLSIAVNRWAAKETDKARGWKDEGFASSRRCAQATQRVGAIFRGEPIELLRA